MRVFNDTPYRAGHIEAMYEPGKPFMAVIVKGTFELVDRERCVPLPKDKQARFERMVNFMDVHGNAPKTPMDTSPFKLRGEFLFIGSAHAPGGIPVEALEVAISIGGMEKKLSVFGNRQWVREADGSASLTQPEPFTEMPVRAEYAHGGLASKYNQHGIGYGSLGEEAGSFLLVANIQSHGQAAVSWERDAPQAGFGMLAPNLLPRRPLLGTYDGVWRTRRQPLPPADFNPAFFNAAPEDQQLDGYFVGDEEIVLRNLHPESPEFRTALPGTSVRCFVNRRLNPDDPEEQVFAEVRTVLDTCIVDVPAGTLTLLWRGTLEIEDRFHRQVEHLLVVEEPVAAPAPVETYAALLRDKLVDKQAEAAKAAEAERQTKIAAIQKEGLAAIVDTLKKGGGQEELVAKIEKARTLDEAQQLISEELEKYSAMLPDA